MLKRPYKTDRPSTKKKKKSKEPVKEQINIIADIQYTS